MNDIYTIKNLINFIPYLKKETWYMFGIGIIIFAIYIGYIIVFEQYYKTQKVNNHLSQEKSIKDLLNNLTLDDIHFFERLSLIIRSYLEISKQVPFATKKTPKDIHGEFLSKKFQEILTECMYYEYANKGAERDQKKKMIERVKEII